jgi:hypothetical protein
LWVLIQGYYGRHLPGARGRSALVGELDPDIDGAVDLAAVRAAPLSAVIY